jgi:hypothetical protein
MKSPTMNSKTTTRLAEIRQHRATVAGEVLGGALLALTRWLSMAARAMRAPALQSNRGAR